TVTAPTILKKYSAPRRLAAMSVGVGGVVAVTFQLMHGWAWFHIVGTSEVASVIVGFMLGGRRGVLIGALLGLVIGLLVPIVYLPFWLAFDLPPAMDESGHNYL